MKLKVTVALNNGAIRGNTRIMFVDLGDDEYTYQDLDDLATEAALEATTWDWEAVE